MIRTALDLSTAHCPGPNPDWKQLRVVKHEYGWIVFVSHFAKEPNWFKPIGDAARESNAIVVIFDNAAHTSDRFAIWNW